MIAVVTLLLVVLVSLLVTRIAAIALTVTGMSREAARFQARSAFSGAGFTTSESESVVSHPVRRRIVGTLILLGNAGLVTAVATLMLSFTNAGTEAGLRRLLVIVAGMAVVVVAARSRWADRWLSPLVERILRQRTDLDARDYASLLHVGGDWRVVELEVTDRGWLDEMNLRDLDLVHEGVLVLGIERSDGRYLGAPTGEDVFHAGDVVLLYGRTDTLRRLDQRRRGAGGELDHALAVAEHDELVEAERHDDADDRAVAGDHRR